MEKREERRKFVYSVLSNTKTISPRLRVMISQYIEGEIDIDCIYREVRESGE